MLFHRIRLVAPLLAPYVEHLWIARGHLRARWRNMILPDGAVEIIFNLGDPQKLCGRDNLANHTVFRESWISGERTEPIVIDEIGHVHLIGVRLRPGGAWLFLGIPMREFTDRVIELRSCLGDEVRDLWEIVRAAENDNQRFELLERWLLQRARYRTSATPSVNRALTLISRKPDRLCVGDIAEQIGISHKHLLREFDRCVGLNPKLFARLCAFQRVIHCVGQKSEVDWAQTAVSCGYCDQAHLIHEFRAFSGLTPTRYLNNRGPFLNYLELP